MRLIRRFVRALGYFTIVPAGAAIDGPPAPEDVALLPLVGACIGLASGSLAYASSFVVPKRVAAAIAYALPIVLTGALHLDGFLDICDAALASVDAERRREILRDPRHGTYAFAGGSIQAIASYAAIVETAPNSWPLTSLLAEAVARCAALAAAGRAESRKDGTAASAFRHTPDRALVIAQSAVLLAAAGASGRRRLLSTLAAFATGMSIAPPLAKRFEGQLGGDAYGFIITTVHLTFLLAASSTPKPDGAA